MTGAAAPRQEDIGRYLGFYGPAPWILLGLFVLSYTYVAFTAGARTALDVVALAVTFLAATLLAAPAPTPLPVWRTVIVVVLIPTALAASLTHPIVDPTGYGVWSLRTGIILMYWLALRARYLAAWIAEGASLAVACGWSIITTDSPLLGLKISYGGILTLFAVTLFARALHATARRIVSHREAERERADREARAAAADFDAEAELRAVREIAQPTLEQIAAGKRPDPAMVGSLEAALRDLIRGRNLAVEPLVTMLRSVRASGTDVLLLDDLADHDLTDAQRTAIAKWATACLAGSRDAASATIRLALHEGKPLASMTLDGGSYVEFAPLTSSAGWFDLPVLGPEFPGQDTRARQR